MGLKTKRNNVTYLTTSQGRLVMRVNEPTETSKERTLTMGSNAGNVVHEEFFDALEGKIIGLFKKSANVPFQNEPLLTLELVMQDSDGDTFQISFPYSSSYTRGLLTKIEKVDLSKECEVCTYWIKGDDGKHRAYLGILQFGEKIAPAYSYKDNSLPEVKKVRVGKKDIYDDEELLAFYDKIVDKFSDAFKSLGQDQKEEAKPLDADDDGDLSSPLPDEDVKF